MRILVADDSKTFLALITNVLEEMGHEVVPVSSGEAAVESFIQNKPDLIILDVVMEEMDGFTCAKQIRMLETDDWIPIIFLSAIVDDESIAKGIDAGGDDYLTKPFSKITLAAKIKAMQRISDMRKKLYETTQKLYLQSSTDSLTGIYNRFQFDRSIEEILNLADKYNHKVALLFIDIDHFKNINDSFCHKVGDLLLIEVAKRLKSCIKANDFLARIGGDEFAIILSEITSIESAGLVSQKIIDAFAVGFEVDSHVMKVGASIGIAGYENNNRIPAATLLQNADISMYHAKSLGRNNYQYFTNELYLKYKQQINLEHALKFALERNEFHLMYQPIFELKTKKIAGLEVLLRWEHPTLGSVPPSLFIPIAEEIGVMQAVGSWVIRMACRQCKDWGLKDQKNFKFAINLSSRQLTQKNIINVIKNLLDENELPPQLLELELTESTIMTNTENAIKDTLVKLHDVGIQIAIDDFGTGYSSLIRLKHLPINTLKIDKTFVQDANKNRNSTIIVTCMLALGRNLNLNVIAEGIETEEQYQFLIENDCSHGQGHLLSKPLSKEDMGKLIELLKRENKTLYPNR